MRFHLDEHVPRAIAEGLRQRGIDITTAADAGLLGASDVQQIAFALAERRVLVTHDDDFLALDAAGVEHAGIAYCHQDKYSIGALLSRLQLLHAVYEDDALHGAVEFL